MLTKQDVFMRTSIFQIDAFTTRRFAGNPAAVMPLDAYLEDAQLQAVSGRQCFAFMHLVPGPTKGGKPIRFKPS